MSVRHYTLAFHQIEQINVSLLKHYHADIIQLLDLLKSIEYWWKFHIFREQ